MTRETAYLTTAEVARIARVDSSTVRRWVLTGRLRPAMTTPGGRHRFNREDVEALLGITPAEVSA